MCCARCFNWWSWLHEKYSQLCCCAKQPRYKLVSRVMPLFWPFVRKQYIKISCNITPFAAQLTQMHHMLICIQVTLQVVHTRRTLICLSYVVLYRFEPLNKRYIWLPTGGSPESAWCQNQDNNHCYCSWNPQKRLPANDDTSFMEHFEARQWVKLTHILQGGALQAALSFTHERGDTNSSSMRFSKTAMSDTTNNHIMRPFNPSEAFETFSKHVARHHVIIVIGIQ